jgi:hypothetical protein
VPHPRARNHQQKRARPITDLSFRHVKMKLSVSLRDEAV